jgi:NADPH:quinone reductase
LLAATLHEFGGELIVAEVNDPFPDDAEILVELTHAAINPLDLHVCAGVFPGTPLPHIPGVEGVGVLEDGTRVVVNGGGIGVNRAGTYASRIAVPGAACTPIPDGVDSAAAATMAVAGITAWRTVHDVAHTTGRDVVLVLGASGGVGTFALQVAASVGARVIAQTSSDRHGALLEDLGADRVVVAAADCLAHVLGGEQPTVVIDGLGGAFTAAAAECLADHGRIINYGAATGVNTSLHLQDFHLKGAALTGYTGLQLSADDKRTTLHQLFEATIDRTLRPTISDQFDLADITHAHDFARAAAGKIIIRTAST